MGINIFGVSLHPAQDFGTVAPVSDVLKTTGPNRSPSTFLEITTQKLQE